MSEMEQALGSTVCFRQRVQDFWAVFLEHEQELRYRMHHQQDPSQSYEFMSRMLQIVFPKPVFRLHTYEDHDELIISPDGSGSRLYQLAYWCMQAPAECASRWEFVLGVPPAEVPETAALELEGFRIYAVQVQIWPVLLQDGRVGIEAYSEALLSLGLERGYTACCALVEQCIGELCLMSHIAYVDLLEQPAMEPGMMLPQLGTYLEEMRMAGQLPPQDDPLGLYTSYTMEPQEQQIYLRDDIFFGNVSAAALPILNGYYMGNHDLFEDAAKEGVVWGFLFFSVCDIEEAQRVNVRGAIEDELNLALSERGLGECVGSASGYQYAYLDCICYDWAGFMEAAEQVLGPYVQLYQLSLTGFAEFRQDGTMYVIHHSELSDATDVAQSGNCHWTNTRNRN